MVEYSFGKSCNRVVSCYRRTECSRRTAQQWSCARLCAGCKTTVQRRAPVWPQVNLTHLQTFRYHIYTQSNSSHPSGIHRFTYCHNWFIHFIWILFYLRWCHCRHQWGEHWRVISSAHSWPHSRIHQLSKVSDTINAGACATEDERSLWKCKLHSNNMRSVWCNVVLCVWSQDGDSLRECGEEDRAGEEDELA